TSLRAQNVLFWVQNKALRTTDNVFRLPCDALRTADNVFRLPCDVLRTADNVFRLPCDVLRTAETVFRLPCDVLRPACTVFRSPCDRRIGAHRGVPAGVDPHVTVPLELRRRRRMAGGENRGGGRLGRLLSGERQGERRQNGGHPGNALFQGRSSSFLRPHPPPPGVSRIRRSPGSTSRPSTDASSSISPEARTRRWRPHWPDPPPAKP